MPSSVHSILITLHLTMASLIYTVIDVVVSWLPSALATCKIYLWDGSAQLRICSITDLFNYRSDQFHVLLHWCRSCTSKLLSYIALLLAQWSNCLPREQGFHSHLRQDYSRSSHTSALKIGTPVPTLPGACRHRVSAGTGWPGVSILWLGETESLICNFYLSVAAHTIVWADPSL